jgi:type IV pilus assembly protein PilX
MIEKRLAGCAPGRQIGAVLVISLLILLVLTILGMSAMGTAGLEEKMAGNARAKDLSFQAAESALRAGEARFQNGGTWATGGGPTVGEAGIWGPDTTGITAANPQTASWWSANAIAPAGNFGDPDPDPRYVIEDYGFVPDSLNPEDLAKRIGVVSFRITARGAVGNTATVLQSVYAKRYR